MSHATGYTAVALVVGFLVHLTVLSANHTVPWHKWLRLPYSLFISNRYSGVPKGYTSRKFWVWDVLDPKDLYTSYFLGAIGALLVRVAVLLYFVAGIVVDGTTNGFGGAYWLLYFTNWSFVLIGLAAVTGIINNLIYIWNQGREQGPRQDHEWKNSHIINGQALVAGAPADPGTPRLAWPTGDLEAPIENGRAQAAEALRDGSGSAQQMQRVAPNSMSQVAPKERREKSFETEGSQEHAAMLYRPPKWTVFQKVDCLVTETAIVTSLMVTIVFWSFVHDFNSGPITAGDWMKHAANSPVMLLLLLTTKIPIVSYHFYFMVVYGTLYELCLWIRYGVSNAWVYSGLNWSRPISAGGYIIVPLIYAVVLIFWYLVALLRNYIGNRLNLTCPDSRNAGDFQFGRRERVGTIQQRGHENGAHLTPADAPPTGNH